MAVKLCMNLRLYLSYHFRLPEHIEKLKQVKKIGRKKYLIIKKS